jgi:hypothetical protein
VSSETISYCDRDSIWTRFLVEEGVKVANEHPESFRVCLYIAFYSSVGLNGPEEITIAWPEGLDGELKILKSFLKVEEENVEGKTIVTLTRGNYTDEVLKRYPVMFEQSEASKKEIEEKEEVDEDIAWENCDDAFGVLISPWEHGAPIMAK